MRRHIDRNTAWQHRVRMLLLDSYGVEDIAIMADLDLVNVRAEVDILRESGELDKMFRGTASRSH